MEVGLKSLNAKEIQTIELRFPFQIQGLNTYIETGCYVYFQIRRFVHG